MIALQKANIPVESYDAYEIDKYAIKVSEHNFPEIKQHGDVFNADFSQYNGIDILMGGGRLALIGRLLKERIEKQNQVVLVGTCFSNT